MRVGSNVRFSSSTPISFLGKSMMCPTDARTSYPLPRYFSIVFALAGDSTITNALLIAILITNPTWACWTLKREFRLTYERLEIDARAGQFCLLNQKLTAKLGSYHGWPVGFHSAGAFPRVCVPTLYAQKPLSA